MAIERESASCCRSCSLWATIAQSSAYNNSRIRASVTFVFARKRCRLKTPPFVQYEIGMPGSEFLKAESIIVLNRKLKSVGASTHPCFTPLETWKSYSSFPLTNPAFMPSWKQRIICTILGGFQFVIGHAIDLGEKQYRRLLKGRRRG